MIFLFVGKNLITVVAQSRYILNENFTRHFRWDAINEENRQTAENKAARKRGEDVEEYEPEVFENGANKDPALPYRSAGFLLHS